jgi:hypothetical protein
VIDPLSSSKTCDSDPLDVSSELREWNLSLCAVWKLAHDETGVGVCGL